MEIMFDLLRISNMQATESTKEKLLLELYYIKKRLEGDFRSYLKGKQGFINSNVIITTKDNYLNILVKIENGTVSIIEEFEDDFGQNCSVVLFGSEEQMKKFMNAELNQELELVIKSQMVVERNSAHFGYFNFLLSLIYHEEKIKNIETMRAKNKKEKFDLAYYSGKADSDMRADRLEEKKKADNEDPGVKHLTDRRYLTEYSLEDFERLNDFKEAYLNATPEVTVEQCKLLTDFHIDNGYEKKNDGTDWNPMLRSAEAFKYIMSRKEPVIRENDLLAGTMTPNPVYGGIVQPNTIGWRVWGDLNIIGEREEEPFNISEKTKEILHEEVFPFWMDKNIEAVWKSNLENYEYDESYKTAVNVYNRKFFVIPWGLISLNPGCPGFADIVKRGLNGLREDIYEARERISNDLLMADENKTRKLINLEAMEISLDAISIYARRLATEVKDQISDAKTIERKAELEKIHEMLTRIPDEPAKTLHEAVQIIWLMFLSIGIDTMNDNMSIGRVDQILQPFFEKEMRGKATLHDRDDYIKEVLEIVGCLFMRLNSHRVTINTRMAWHSSGAPTATALVLGGVTPDGKDAVNDMSYIILKATEMFCVDNPDIDVRYYPGINSRSFLERSVEVNYLTSGTPAIHNDYEVIRGWSENNPHWDIEDIRNWVSCGCTEPVMQGKHFAASGDLDSNLVVPLEMALNNGNHPKWKQTLDVQFGPEFNNYNPLDPDFGYNSFNEFYKYFVAQFEFIFDNFIEFGSQQILNAQKTVMPAPLYSALLDGCIKNGEGMLDGGAKYNSAGAAIIGLSDVIDSLLVIKKIVFESKAYSFQDLKEAIDSNFGENVDDTFENKEEIMHRHRKIFSTIRHTVPKFGSGDAEANKMAEKVTNMIGNYFHSKATGRGGKYTAGYKSASNHMVYGMVSDACPSGRRAKEPFTPGLTPSPTATKNIMDNLLDVAALDSTKCENNFAFNVRLSFSKHNSYKENIQRVTDYLDTYFKAGGMQVQLNMVDADTLKDAMANPENYQDLIVRISGYTGYFARLHTELQLEILKRAEFAL